MSDCELLTERQNMLNDFGVAEVDAPEVGAHKLEAPERVSNECEVLRLYRPEWDELVAEDEVGAVPGDHERVVAGARVALHL